MSKTKPVAKDEMVRPRPMQLAAGLPFFQAAELRTKNRHASCQAAVCVKSAPAGAQQWWLAPTGPPRDCGAKVSSVRRVR